MRKSIIILCILLAVVGCRPRGVLSNSEMRDVLYDLHRVDGALQVAGYNYGHSQELAAYYKSVLDKHGITQAQFDSSLVWFTDNPQIFNKIYPRVIDRLQADLDVEEALREERIAKIRNEKYGKAKPKERTPVKPLRPWEDVMDEYQNGLKNPWQEWKVEEFCEKDVIIFGQVQTDAQASIDTLVTSRVLISSPEGTQPPRSYGR